VLAVAALVVWRVRRGRAEGAERPDEPVNS
jgi:hypothetical protein